MKEILMIGTLKIHLFFMVVTGFKIIVTIFLNGIIFLKFIKNLNF